MSDALLVLASVSWIAFVSAYLLDRDPDLGYLSDPEVGRWFAYVLLPGVAWLVALTAWSSARLARSAPVAWVTVLASMSLTAAASWLPVGALIG